MRTLFYIIIIYLLPYSHTKSQSSRLFSKKDIVWDIIVLIEDIENI
jgi:hypothetical protein